MIAISKRLKKGADHSALPVSLDRLCDSFRRAYVVQLDYMQSAPFFPYLYKHACGMIFDSPTASVKI